jgi:ribosomal-protein-alanine N-acetyltransferase
MLPEILRIQAEVFKCVNREKLVNYSKIFKEIFYVIKNKDKVIGYCIYYLKQAFF